MKITKISIKKFRGFKDVECELGSHVTVITGRNGTQKSTLLGMLSQTFTLKMGNPMRDEKPLSGGNYISSFKEKFRLSAQFDKPGTHEWTLHFDKREPFTIESMQRSAEDPTLRFWQKGKRGKGDGYIDYPVIFLSLQRLIPIAESGAAVNKAQVLTEEEKKFFYETKTEILTTVNEKEQDVKAIGGTSKNTLGYDTDVYDWEQNSAGQDNLGKIIASIISFQRLQKKFSPKKGQKGWYEGGLLVIDELDATMHPSSQEKLFDFLFKQAAKLSLQVIFTTHSLSLMRYVCSKVLLLQAKEEQKNQIKIAVLEKVDGFIKIKNGDNFNFVKNNLQILQDAPKALKLKAYTEDPETKAFASNLLQKTGVELCFEPSTMSCSTYLTLVENKISSFISKDVVLILDGDVRKNKTTLKKVQKIVNIFLLPGTESPERELAHFLYSLSDADELWEKINSGYSKSVCFKNFPLHKIDATGDDGRKSAKAWFNEQKRANKYWLPRVLSRWKKEHSDEVENFVCGVKKYYDTIFLKSLMNNR